MLVNLRTRMLLVSLVSLVTCPPVACNKKVLSPIHHVPRVLNDDSDGLA